MLKTLFAAPTLLLGLLMLGSPAFAQEPAVQPVISGSLTGEQFFAGESVYFHDVDAEDIFAAGSEVIIEDSGLLDVFAAGCPVRFSGSSARKLYAAGCQIQIEGVIEEGLAAVGGQIRLAPDAAVRGYVAVAGGQVDLSGRIEGNLHVAGGRVGVFGFVGGDARIGAGRIHIGPQARIEGDLEYIGEQPPRISQGAVISGEVRRITIEPPVRFAEHEYGPSRGEIIGFVLLFWLVMVVGFSILTGAAQLVMPRALDLAAGQVKLRPWACLGIGLAVFVTWPVVTGLLFFSVIGIPLAAVSLAVYLSACALGLCTAAYWLGCPPARADVSKAPGKLRRFAGSALGIAILAVVFLIPVLGWLAVGLVVATGLGAFMLSFYQERTIR